MTDYLGTPVGAYDENGNLVWERELDINGKVMKIKEIKVMEKFYDKISKKLYKAIKKDAKRVLKEMEDEKLYSVALVTDSDCITLFMSLNTYEYLETADEDYIEVVKEDLSEEDLRKIEDGEVCLTKWLPDEWGYSDGENSELVKISQLLSKKESTNPDEYAKHKSLFFDTVISVFKKLIEEKIFGENSEEVTYFISTSDGDYIYKLENYSAKMLNSKEKYEQFLNRKEIGV